MEPNLLSGDDAINVVDHYASEIRDYLNDGASIDFSSSNYIAETKRVYTIIVYYKGKEDTKLNT